MNAEPLFIIPEQPLAPGVHIVSTSRIGGISDKQYASFNLGLHCGDTSEHVLANRELLVQALELPSEPCWLSQVHGTDILELNQAINSNPVADGAYTYGKNIVCAIMTADCLPLVLCDKNANQLMAIHAGWRGVANGIVEKAVALFDCPPDCIRAWSGPCIGPNAFEVGPEVIKLLGGNSSAYRVSENGAGRQYINLMALVRTRLADQGVIDYINIDQCTYADTQRFFSYRRDGQTGRMATLIWKDV